MAGLDTNYLGLELKNPLMASASPLSKKVSMVKRLEDSGVSAVVMYSLFQEQIDYTSKKLNYFLSRGTDQFAEALTYLPDLGNYNIGPDAYMEHIRTLKECVDIPIIASLNGVTNGDWVKNAEMIEQAGADALELNIYHIVTDETVTAQSVEKNVISLVSSIRNSIHIPLGLKLSPFYSALPNLIGRVIKGGIDGFVLFNRFLQPDLDIEALEIDVHSRLSTSDDLLLPLRWIAILYGRVNADLAISGGIHNARDVVKGVMAGANVTMVASEFLANGPEQAVKILDTLNSWMDAYGYATLKDMRGSLSQEKVVDPAAFERAQYMKALQKFDHQLP
ncbi:MAG: dihydroorotate dehydrogenase-like protein [Anaerolineaceae bacterium]|nr:dihydroorotate dehydrogenase-like protein [Anaerolineaceae bacterium]